MSWKLLLSLAHNYIPNKWYTYVDLLDQHGIIDKNEQSLKKPVKRISIASKSWCRLWSPAKCVHFFTAFHAWLWPLGRVGKPWGQNMSKLTLYILHSHPYFFARILLFSSISDIFSNHIHTWVWIIINKYDQILILYAFVGVAIFGSIIFIVLLYTI